MIVFIIAITPLSHLISEAEAESIDDDGDGQQTKLTAPDAGQLDRIARK
jgi:hypothetical protein